MIQSPQDFLFQILVMSGVKLQGSSISIHLQSGVDYNEIIIENTNVLGGHPFNI